MSKTKIKYFITFFLILPFLNATIVAVDEVKQRRQFEHQAVKEFLNNKLINPPRKTQIVTMPNTLKYSLDNYLQKNSETRIENLFL